MGQCKEEEKRTKRRKKRKKKWFFDFSIVGLFKTKIRKAETIFKQREKGNGWVKF
jgi:hypothetical protein